MRKNVSSTTGLISVIPVFYLFILLADVFEVLFGKNQYPFNTEFFNRASIYQSKELYLAYNFVAIILLLLMLYLSFKEKWRAYYVLLIINILLFIYPILTFEYNY